MFELEKNDNILKDNILFKVRILFILIFSILVITSRSGKVFAFDEYADRHLFETSVAKELVLEADKIEAIKTSIIVPESSPCYYKEDNEVKVCNAFSTLKKYAGKEYKADRLGNLYKVDLDGKIYYLPVIATKGLDEYEYIVYEEVIKEDDFNRKRIYGYGMPTSIPKYIQDEVNDFKNRISEKSSFQDIISEYIISMYNIGLNYGGSISKQGDYENGNTMCMGFTYVIEQLLSKSNLKYRIVSRGPNKVTSEMYGHIWVEVFNEEDEKWYKIETTSMTYDNLNGEKERKGGNWILSKYDNIINKDTLVEPFNLKRRLVEKGRKKTSEYIIEVSSEYKNQVKVGNKGYKLIRREFSAYN